MRFAYVMTSLGVGGAERQVLALAEHMVAHGHAVLLLVLRDRQPEESFTTLDPDFIVHLNMRKNPFSLCWGLTRAGRYLRHFMPDLIHSHTFPGNMIARLLGVAFPKIAVLSTIHNVYEGEWPRMLAYRITDPLCRHTTAVSEATANRYVRLKAVPARKISVLTNGIDITEFAPSPERRACMRKKMGSGDEFIWLTAGRIAPAKDYPNLLNAFALVNAEYPETRLWVAGNGDFDSLSDLILLTDKLKMRGRIRWLGMRRDMPALLDAADGFVLASAWEGMPLAVGEAMAMEMPVVVTDVGGVRELVGEAGVIVPAQEPDSLARAMLALMQNSLGARTSLGRAARKRIQNHFDFEARTGNWELFYRELVSNRP